MCVCLYVCVAVLRQPRVPKAIWPFPELKTPRSVEPKPHGNKLLPASVCCCMPLAVVTRLWLLLPLSVPWHFACAAPYEFLTADHILAPRPANTFCKINEKTEKTTAKKCRRPRRAARRPSLLLTTPLSLLEKSTWQPSPPTGGDVLRAPAACCCQHQHAT